MNLKETAQLLTIINGVYPNLNIGDLEFTAGVWQNILGDYDYNLLQSAFKAYALTPGNKFAPSPSELVEKVAELKGFKYPTLDEVIREMNKALANCSNNGEASRNMSDACRLAFAGTTDRQTVSNMLYDIHNKTSCGYDMGAPERALKKVEREFLKLEKEAKLFDGYSADLKKQMAASGKIPPLAMLNPDTNTLALGVSNNLQIEEK